MDKLCKLYELYLCSSNLSTSNMQIIVTIDDYSLAGNSVT